MYTYEYIVKIVSYKRDKYIDTSETTLHTRGQVKGFLMGNYNECWTRQPHNDKWGHQNGWTYTENEDGFREEVTVLEKIVHVKPYMVTF